MAKFKVYVIDDEDIIRDGIKAAFNKKYRIEGFDTAEKGIEAIGKKAPEVTLLDIGLPGMSGLEAMEKIKAIDDDIVIIMITGMEEVKTVVSAMKKGAHNYIVKPLDMNELEVTIDNALETVKLRREVRALQEKYLEENVPCFIAESEAIQNVMEFVNNIAKSPDTPVLIQGETGTGKELVASAIHYRSPNYKGPFITVNCSAIPKDLIESELFGYEKGAFSGALPGGKKGMIEEAEDGTLFLDEVGDLSSEAQAKLLRFLENGEISAVGSTKTKKVRTRIVSATNKDLATMMEHEEFREDLYFRLAVVKVAIPSLEERRADIMPLAKFFIDQYNKKFGKNIESISPEAEQLLKLHKWTGNIRELRNMMERAILVCAGTLLEPEDLALERKPKGEVENVLSGNGKFPRLTDEGLDLESTQEELEKYYIEEALRLAGGNESKAAKLLKINHHTFRYRRKKLGIENE
ncbi:MAG: response regulator [candidate division Zixibacteria bacterium]|nr:response regulator [candidate division Zixibacteria bacterium]